MKSFVETSSVKGAGKVLKSKTVCQRVLWSLTLLTGMGVTTFQLTLLFMAYFQYPITMTTIESESVMPFPDISVCNLVPTSEQVVGELFQDHLRQNVIPRLNILPSDQEIWDLNFDEVTNEQLTLYDLSDTAGFWQNLDVSRYPELQSVLPKFVRDCKWSPWKFKLAELSNEYTDFGNYVKCDIDIANNITEHTKFFFNQYYGGCVTFTLPKSYSTKIRSFTGVFYVQDYGEGYSQLFDANPDFSHGSGVAVYVHPHNTLPLMSDAIHAAAGFQTSITVDVTQRKRLGDPHGKCTNRKNLPKSPNYKYTYESCRATCQQVLALSKCQCLDYHATVTPNMLQSYSFCGKFYPDFNVTARNYDCALFYVEESSAVSGCTCLPPCDELTIETSASSTVWPHRQYKSAMFYDLAVYEIDDWQRFVVANETDIFGVGDADIPEPDYDLLRENFLQINVKLAGVNLTVVEDRAAMTIVGIIASMGGILNLWIGT